MNLLKIVKKCSRNQNNYFEVIFFCDDVMYSVEYDVCDVTLSVYPHRGSLKNMPGHGGNRTNHLWNTSHMWSGDLTAQLSWHSIGLVFLQVRFPSIKQNNYIRMIKHELKNVGHLQTVSDGTLAPNQRQPQEIFESAPTYSKLSKNCSKLFF